MPTSKRTWSYTPLQAKPEVHRVYQPVQHQATNSY